MRKAQFNSILKKWADKLDDTSKQKVVIPKERKVGKVKKWQCPACFARFERQNQLRGHIRQSPPCQSDKPSKRRLKRKEFSAVAAKKYKKYKKKQMKRRG